MFALRVAALALIIAGAGLAAFAATLVPLQNLSTSQRVSTSPDSTAVKVGSLTTTLGKLRTAHKSREAARTNAKTAGSSAHVKLTSLPLKVIRVGTPIKLHKPKSTPPPYIIQPGHVVYGPWNLSTSVVEPSSQYASTPNDMKAFCASAKAAACAYLPPQQQVIARNDSIDNVDAIITSAQCAQEGGTRNGSGGGVQSVAACDFYYQMGVTVHFNPGSGLKISQSAVCNSPWTYGVDVHGAVWISLSSSIPQNQFWTTGSSATCIVRVAVGG